MLKIDYKQTVLKINYKQVYESNEFGSNDWIVIIYDISANHYVGVLIYSLEKEGYIYLKSINKYADVSNIKDYNRSKITKCVYKKNRPLSISNSDYNKLIKSTRDSLVNFLDDNITYDIDGISYLKWCRDKYKLNKDDIKLSNLKQNGIYWVNMGVNVGSELRKLRPAILWRATSDKKTWTMIPLTTKKRNDNYYFHYDLECLNEGSAKVENMMNYSYKRILAPYYSKNKLAIISKKDYINISKIISRYYLFK